MPVADDRIDMCRTGPPCNATAGKAGTDTMDSPALPAVLTGALVPAFPAVKTGTATTGNAVRVARRRGSAGEGRSVSPPGTSGSSAYGVGERASGGTLRIWPRVSSLPCVNATRIATGNFNQADSLFSQFGMLERCALRHGDVHSADGWRKVLDPFIARYATSGRSFCLGSLTTMGQYDTQSDLPYLPKANKNK